MGQESCKSCGYPADSSGHQMACMLPAIQKKEWDELMALRAERDRLATLVAELQKGIRGGYFARDIIASLWNEQDNRQIEQLRQDCELWRVCAIRREKRCEALERIRQAAEAFRAAVLNHVRRQGFPDEEQAMARLWAALDSAHQTIEK